MSAPARTRDRVATWTLPVVGVMVSVGLWWLAVELFDVRSFVVPSPPDVAAAMTDNGGYLLRMTRVTFGETAAGFGLAVAAGVAIGVAVASSRVLERTVYPLLVAINAVPKVAIAPIFVIWMGFGPAPKVVMVLVVSFFPIVISTASGLRATPTDLVELARSLNAGWAGTLLKIRFPSALPQIFVGLKTAISLAVIGAVIGEFVGADAGLGYVVVQSGASADTALAFAAITLLGAMSIVLFYLLVALEHVLLPWAEEQR